MNPELLKQINWKTVGWAIGYVACNAMGGLFPEYAHGCKMLEVGTVAGGLISAADATRVQNVVRAVDALLWKNNMDPDTLQKIDGPKVIEVVPAPPAA